MVKAKDNSTVNAKTFKRVAKFESEASQIDHIQSSTSVIDILNQELKRGAVSMGSGDTKQATTMQKTLMGELSTHQQAQVQAKIQQSFTTDQRAQVTQFVPTILTVSQKQQVAAASTQTNLMTMLNAQQKQKLQAYSMSLLTATQKQTLMRDVMTMLPKVQNMSTKTLQTLLYSDSGKLPKAMAQLLPKNGKYILIQMPTTAKASMNDYQACYSDIQDALKKSGLKNSDYTVKIGGQPALFGTVGKQMMRSMGIMLAAAVIVMMVILLALFPVRRRLLPLVVVLFGIVWTFGLMGWLGINLTMATMATLPILIGLGTDFGVQFLNRYEEEFHKQTDLATVTDQAARTTGPAVGTAVVVMIMSFLTMHLSKAPMMKDFGTTLALGVAISFVVEFLLMFAILALFDKKAVLTTATTLVKPSRLSRVLQRYARWVMKHAVIIVIIGAIVGGAGFFFEEKINIETDMTTMVPQDMAALKANKELIKIVGSQTRVTYMVQADDVRDTDVVNYMKSFGKQEQGRYSDEITGVSSLATTLKTTKADLSSQAAINQAVKHLPNVMRQQVVTKDHKAATITFTFDKDLDSAQGLKLMNKISQDAKNPPKGVKMSVVGNKAESLQGVANTSANHGLIIAAGLAIIFIVLLVVYRRPKKAIYPLLPIAIVLGLSPLTLYILGISYNPLTIALSSLVLGIGTEFTILVLERFSEEQRSGSSVATDLETAIGSVGQAITVSGLTVVGAFFTLLFVNFPILQSFGLITVLDTAYSLLVTLTIMPAVIYLFRKRQR
jgi:hydrophobe/amphiphile efflux-3 (HAE3) family protein